MARVRLTAGRIALFAVESGRLQSFLWDEELRQLAVRANPGGRKCFVFQSRCNSSAIRLTIGSVSVWAIEDARREAWSFRIRTDRGQDPRRIKAARIAEEVERRAVAERTKLQSQNFTALAIWDKYASERAAKRWSRPSFSDREPLVNPRGKRSCFG